MTWKVEAELLAQYTIIGKRQAQIYILLERGYDTEKIQTKLKEVTDTPPEKPTIRSTKHDLKNKLSEINELDKLLNSKDKKIQPPLNPPEGVDNDNIQVYVGQVGCGKTVTAKTHIHRAIEEDPTTSVFVVDPVDSWKGTEIMQQDGEFNRHGLDPTKITSKENIQQLVKKAIEEWKRDSAPAELIIDNGTQIINGDIWESLVDQEEKTVRLITQTYNPGAALGLLEPSQYHIHRLSEANTQLLANTYDLTEEDQEYITQANMATGDKIPEVLTVTRNGNKYRSTVKLTEREEYLFI
jgi:hypothetical protein